MVPPGVRWGIRLKCFDISRPHRPTLLVAGLLVACMVVTLGSTVSPAAAASLPTGGCAQVIVLGARGSGELGSKTDLFLGTEVHNFYASLAKSLDGHLTYTSYSLPYQAASVETLVPSKSELAGYLAVPVIAPLLYQRDHLSPFQASIKNGTSNGISLLRDLSSMCTTARFVVVGYSQGAMAWHKALAQLGISKSPADTALLARIAGVALIADGDRVKNTAARGFGTADGANAQGVEVALLNDGGDIPSSIVGRTSDFCDKGDLVCNFDLPSYLGHGTIAKDLRAIDKAVKVHLAYGNSKPLGFMAYVMAQSLIAPSGPPPPATLVSTTGAVPTGMVGSAYSAALSASGGTAPYTWAIDGILPPGLGLTVSPETIAGIPTASGTFDFVLRLADAATQSLLLPMSITVVAPPAADASASMLNGVACPSLNYCLAVGTDYAQQVGVVVPIVNGVPGGARSVPGTSSLRAIACSDTTTCVAVGDGGVVVQMINGLPGAAQVIGSNYSVDGVACPSVGTCEVVGTSNVGFGSAFVATVVRGVPGATRLVPNVGELHAIACPTINGCIAVGDGDAFQGGMVVSLTDGVPGPAIVVARTQSLAGVACWSSTNCEAVGTNTAPSFVSVEVPISDGLPGAVVGQAGTELLGIACPGSNSCEVVGTNSYEGVIAKDGAGSVLVPGSLDIQGIACASAASCWAVGWNLPSSGVTTAVILPVANGIPGAII
jgi:hypothetical protein